ncbi:MAG TPA: LLM class flavin-dependent oxidoreductase [Acetobacteraceae bacterium]|nr:LLM class flavin-dependent oxidoreductase [Acetobacteraceae bacterium]
MRLSVLDQSTIVSGRSPDSAIRESLALARHCEALGYARYWLAEHHNSDSQAGTAPEILIAAIAATTTRMRVGSAGVMLPHYASLKVAEEFRVLEAIAPGRIDLGLGRAPGSDGRTAYALNPNADSAAENFPAQVAEVLDWLAGRTPPETHPFHGVRAQPAGPTMPEVWMLGSSDYGARVAAYFGLPYCFAHFITDGRGAAEAIEIYRRNYRPSARHPEATVVLCVFAIAAETEEEAEPLFLSRALWRLHRDRGVFPPFPSPEEAAAYPYSEAEQARVERMRARSFFGAADHVAEQLAALGQTLKVEEIAVLTTTHDPAARRRSYTLLARAFSLSPTPVPA